MEGLSAAASGIAVVSVAIQLAESFKKLSDFWKSIKEAPEDIRAISTDLDLVSSVLAEIARDTQHVAPDDTLIAVLNACWDKVKLLTGIVNQIEPGFASASLRVRKWTSFKAVLRRGELIKFQEGLERLKSTLLLVQQNQCNRLSRNRHITLEQSLAAIVHTVSGSSIQQNSLITARVPAKVTNPLGVEAWDATEVVTGNMALIQSHHANSGGPWSVVRKPAQAKYTLRETNTVIETFLGTIRAKSTTTSLMLDQTGDGLPRGEKQYETSYTIFPAQWLVRLGVQYGFHLDFLTSSTRGWKNSLNTFCPVPDDALIFEFCQQGNVSAVRNLLSGGRASVRDTNSQGYTPLHFAAENHHPELCEILKTAGADMTTLTNDAETPLILAAKRSEKITQAMLSEVFDTFRLLTDSIDFSEENSHGWDIMDDLCKYAYMSSQHPMANVDLLLSMLRILSFDLRTYVSKRRFAAMLFFVINPEPGPAEAFKMILNLGGHDTIDEALDSRGGISVLHAILAIDPYEYHMTFLLSRNPDVHRLGFDTDLSPYKESPTTLAMYSCDAFISWLRALANNKVDLESFVDHELEQNHEVHPGWVKKTLLHLFAYDDRPDLTSYNPWACSDCKAEYSRVVVQPYWRHIVERIRTRLHPYDPTVIVFEGTEENDDNELPSQSISDEDENKISAKSDTEEDDDKLASESESEEDTSEYRRRGPINSKCLYDKREVVCMDCWLYYARTGTRKLPVEELSEDEEPASDDDSSEDEFSPFHIHS